MNDMANVIEKTPKTLANEISNYHLYCNCMRSGQECGKDTAAAVIKVRDALGKLRVGAFSEFGYVKYQGETKKILLKAGYTYAEWVTRCALCNQRDMQMAGKTAVPIPKSDPRYDPHTIDEKFTSIEVMRKAIKSKTKRL